MNKIAIKKPQLNQMVKNITDNYSHWLSFLLLLIVAAIIDPSFFHGII